MYGGSSKVGRGGGPKRLQSTFPLLSHRGSAPPGGGRPSIGGSSGGPRGRNPTRGTPGNPPAVEETFSLVSGNNPLAFAMIIRLAPDLVEEIKRVEAQGGRARMKFDPNPNNPSGNIIDVGGKEFRFTWSREFGDLCDIYEEHHSGEDGRGLLAESGSAWRKLNVQRILDESTKNHVKMRSEEAERKNKSRKAIVLEPGNPSMKSQIKALAAVEATPWKNYTKKKEAALKKRKVETPQVGGPPKSTHKSGLSSSATKGRHSSSPLPSPPEQFATPSSPLGTVNIFKNLDDVPSQVMGKQNTTTVSEKENTTRIDSAVRETPGSKGNNGAKSMDLQSLLISFLMDKPSGMTIRALEKAVGDTFPNSSKKIEPIIKKIATFQAPGRYILKPGVDLESFKKPLSESGSSPEDNLHRISAHGEFHDQTPALQGGFEEKVPNENVEEHVQSNSKAGEESNTLNTIDVHQNSPNVFDDKKGSDCSEGQAGSSSDSGSDSDSESDSSGSGSDSGSHSRSRSRSPAGTGSGSSSDSESDASSNSKEGSDEDVDIMTSDDEKESKLKMEVSDQRVPSLIPVKSPDGRSMQNEIDEKQDGNESDVVEIEKDLPEEQGAEIAPTTTTIFNKGGKASEETKHCYPDCDDFQERQNYIGSLFDERKNTVKVSSRHDLSDSSERLSSGKHKRGSDVKSLDEKSERTKKLKTDNFTQAMGSAGMDVQMSENSKSLSEDTFKGPTAQAVNRSDRQGNLNAGLQKGYNQSFSTKSSDFQRTFDQTSLGKPPDPLGKTDRHGESLGRSRKHSEKGFHLREGPSMDDKSQRESQNDDIYTSGRKVPGKSREGSNGSKQLVSSDSNYQKLSEMSGKFREGRQGAPSHPGTSPKDNNLIGPRKSPVINGRGITLQRELSDLELGELRESTPDETHVTKQFERKSSFKHLENRAGTSEDKNPDVSKVKSSSKTTLESGKRSPSLVGFSFLSNLESANKKKNADDHFEDSTRSHAKALQSHPQHVKDHMEAGSQINKLPEINGRSRNNEAGVSQGIDLEGRESNRRGPTDALKHDSKRGTVSNSMKEGRRQTSNPLEEMADGGKDLVLADRNNSDQKRRESSSDENSCSYSKYEKDEPELKGPIRTFSQYKEYVNEYRDKYDSYCSLNKILESYRNEFLKLGKDLEYAKGRDMDRYYNILGQLKESYQRCGERHKRLKKIFIVLHGELEQLKQRIKDFARSYTKD
ncbi:uncharacterized protein LOC129290862 [Prosopis cineraria]|uniref:uncharacterized protein LOC129290862 n=1 Tax=Prosopis cineraria TaxID=364024 RepID=UPI00240FC581|nr:uncharacterized protein LOC129290862 [Prosopis cineraria]